MISGPSTSVEGISNVNGVLPPDTNGDVGLTNAGSTTVTIPAGTELGTYYVMVSSDDTNAVLESAETNNVSYGITKVGPDLTESALTAPASAISGATNSVTDTVKNTGGGSSGASTTRIYFSNNITFDGSDQPLGERTVISLGPNATSSGATSVTIPPVPAPGIY